MRTSHLVPDQFVPDLGEGAGFVLWGVRACAMGHGDRAWLYDGLASTFGRDGKTLAQSLLALTEQFGRSGNRRVMLCAPGDVHLTYDELAILGLIEAAQRGAHSCVLAHLLWLVGQSPCANAQSAASTIGQILCEHGCMVKPILRLVQACGDVGNQSISQEPTLRPRKSRGCNIPKQHHDYLTVRASNVISLSEWRQDSRGSMQ